MRYFVGEQVTTIQNLSKKYVITEINRKIIHKQGVTQESHAYTIQDKYTNELQITEEHCIVKSNATVNNMLDLYNDYMFLWKFLRDEKYKKITEDILDFLSNSKF